MNLDVLWAGWRSDYVTKAATQPAGGDGADDHACVFCRIVASGPPSRDNGVLYRGTRTLAVLNAYPYSNGHLMVVPLRHVASLAELTGEEGAEMWATATVAVSALESAFQPEGVNLGANLGRAAGAGIPQHLHLHVVPRWVGDTNFMTTVAGVRVLPESLEATWERLHAAWPT